MKLDSPSNVFNLTVTDLAFFVLLTVKRIFMVPHLVYGLRSCLAVVRCLNHNEWKSLLQRPFVDFCGTLKEYWTPIKHSTFCSLTTLCLITQSWTFVKNYWKATRFWNVDFHIKLHTFSLGVHQRPFMACHSSLCHGCFLSTFKWTNLFTNREFLMNSRCWILFCRKK